jgi:fringe protein
VGEKMRLPDDVTMGYVIEQLTGVPMTRLEEFHSHLEPLHLVTNLPAQISFSYSEGSSERNLIEVEGGGRSLKEDPTRFLSIHCALFPETRWCNETEEYEAEER